MNQDEIEYLSAVLRKTVRTEIRVAAILDQPATLSPLPADHGAEDRLIATAREGVIVEGLDPRDFSRPLHELLWVVLCEAKAAGVEPTTDKVFKVLAADGWTGSGLREEVERLFDKVPFAWPASDARSVRRCARLRRVCILAQQLDALARTQDDDEQLRAVAAKIQRELVK